MFEYRITKYDPSQRDKQGRYLGDTWTSFADIGKRFDSVTLSIDAYDRVESAYITSALSFMKECCIHRLTAVGVESLGKCEQCAKEGEALCLEQIPEVLRALLREEFWCRLEGETGFIHVGWDFYMYIGVQSACPYAKQLALKEGLFIEEFESPYRTGR